MGKISKGNNLVLDLFFAGLLSASQKEWAEAETYMMLPIRVPERVIDWSDAMDEDILNETGRCEMYCHVFSSLVVSGLATVCKSAVEHMKKAYHSDDPQVVAKAIICKLHEHTLEEFGDAL